MIGPAVALDAVENLRYQSGRALRRPAVERKRVGAAVRPGGHADSARNRHELEPPTRIAASERVVVALSQVGPDPEAYRAVPQSRR